MTADKSNKRLGGRVMNEVILTSVFQGIAVVSDIFLTIVLSRLLTPTDFGIVATAAIFIALCNLFRELGIKSAIIQLPELNKVDEQSGMAIVIISSVVIFVAAQGLAPAFADFMHVPEAELVLRILSFVILVQGLGSTAEGLILRRLGAREIRIVEVLARIVGYAVLGVALALAGAGYWALVAASIADAALRTLAFLIIAKPSLTPRLDLDSARRLLRVSGGFTLSRLINFVAVRGDNTVVGRYLDAAALGMYSRAYKLMSMPTEIYGQVADRVVFPAMARVQREPERLRVAYMRGLALTALIGVPMTVVLCLLAGPIVSVLLGNQWAGVVPVFSVLALGTYFRLSARVSGSVLRARGSTGQLVSNQVVYAVLTVGGSLLAVPYGLTAVGAAVGVGIAVWFIYITTQACRSVGVSLAQLLRLHLEPVLLAVIVGAVVVLLRTLGLALQVTSLLTLAFVGIGLGAFGLALLRLKPRILLGGEGRALAIHVDDLLSRFIRGLRKSRHAV